jgi:hypothetical protein
LKIAKTKTPRKNSIGIATHPAAEKQQLQGKGGDTAGPTATSSLLMLGEQPLQELAVAGVVVDHNHFIRLINLVAEGSQQPASAPAAIPPANRSTSSDLKDDYKRRLGATDRA